MVYRINYSKYSSKGGQSNTPGSPPCLARGRRRSASAPGPWADGDNTRVRRVILRETRSAFRDKE